MLKDFSPREYQADIFSTAAQYNTLVVLPTGLGKTAIAMMLAARRQLNYPSSKVVILAPTKPLVEQHAKSFKDQFMLSSDSFALFTGAVSPKKRHELWKSARFIFSTPQSLENDILSGKLSFEDVSLLVVDEAHRAVGDYAYVFLASKYVDQARHPKILALTASPGTTKEKIDEVAAHVFAEKIEYRKITDKDVAKFAQGSDISWETVVLSEDNKRIVAYLQKCYISKLEKVKEFSLLKYAPSSYKKIALLELQRSLHQAVSKDMYTPEHLQSISLLAEALKVQHALELAETQTLYALHEYLYGILSSARTAKTRAVKNLARDPFFLSALSLTRDLLKDNKEHPKLHLLAEKVKQFLQSRENAKIIIFTQYRNTALRVEETIKSFCSSSLFFGQQKKNGIGFSQKKQKEVLDRFRENDFSCLIATSVAEEGLDIPSVDAVFFYEPIPSAIRSVQRRGRTGRHTRGFVTVFLTKDTRDEAYRWVAFHKEKRMYSLLDSMSKQGSIQLMEKKEQSTLEDFSAPSSKNVQNEFRPKVVADFREKGSPVLKILSKYNVDLELKQLSVGDFILSKNVCVEYKIASDFVDSIVDGRLLTQLRSLSQYTKPIILIEGDPLLYLSRNVSASAVRGMLATIVLSYKIPILHSSSPLETAKLLILLASKEQEDSKETFSYHSAKPLDDAALQEYIIGSFPQIGGVLAKSLLENFDSLHKFLSSSEADLKNISLIGTKKAAELYRFFHLSYSQSKNKHLKSLK